MHELLLLLIFVVSFTLFGVSFLTVAIVIGVSLLLMLFLGMVGILFKLLPWIIVLALVIYWLKRQRT
jgi:phage shock protein G